jgi:hypothetical protein
MNDPMTKAFIPFPKASIINLITSENVYQNALILKELGDFLVIEL